MVVQLNPRAIGNMVANRNIVNSNPHIQPTDIDPNRPLRLWGTWRSDFSKDLEYLDINVLGQNRSYYREEVIVASSPGDMMGRLRNMGITQITLDRCLVVFDEMSDPYWLDLITHSRYSRFVVMGNPNVRSESPIKVPLGICAGNRVVYLVYQLAVEQGRQPNIHSLNKMEYCWVNNEYLKPHEEWPAHKDHNHLFIVDGEAILTRTDYFMSYIQLNHFFLSYRWGFKWDYELIQNFWPSPLHKLVKLCGGWEGFMEKFSWFPTIPPPLMIPTSDQWNRNLLGLVLS